MSSSPLLNHTISAGFPSPADDYTEGNLNIGQYLVPHPITTFFIRVSGDSMIGASIHEGDLLIVDRALTAHHNDIVVAVIDNEFTVKRLHFQDDICSLEAENEAYPPLLIQDPDNLLIWGVVTHTIHSFR